MFHPLIPQHFLDLPDCEKFGYDRRNGLQKHYAECSGGHDAPDNDFLDTQLGAAFHLLDCRNNGLGTIHAKPLCAGIFLVQVFLELFSIDQTLAVARLPRSVKSVRSMASSVPGSR